MFIVLIVTGIGFLLSLLITIVDLKYEINENNEFEKHLPGYNCGACGFNTCLGMAKAMEKDPLNYKKCRPLRGDKLKEMEAYLKLKKLI